MNGFDEGLPCQDENAGLRNLHPGDAVLGHLEVTQRVGVAAGVAALIRGRDVVGAFPNPAALLRLAGHALIELRDECDGADRRYFSEHSMKLLNVETVEVAIPEPAAA